MTPQATERLARDCPKVLLHEHLDGGLRVATLHELLAERGLPSPAADVAGLAAWFDAHAHADSLERYLEGFGLTVHAMATPAALRRVAFEAAEDARADGCVLAEFRIAPLLFEGHGLDGDTVVDALLAGLRDSALPSGLIVCAMRHLAPDETRRAAELSLRWQGRGVIGFDLAGAEAGYPPSRHATTLRRVRDAGLPITLHAGEADDGRRVLEAAEHGAVRIGHGVRLAEALGRPDGAALLDAVRNRGLHLEVCPTSNVHTGAYASLAAHPITALWRAGIECSFHTDNRLMSAIDMSTEAANLVRECGLTPADLAQMSLCAAHRSFLPWAARAAAAAAVQDWADRHGLALPTA
ncbi:MAG: adenosine deaminase family protein [Rubrivivax sp.]|nr:adenosine deaminase family protein [Rubrivivax sp.]MDH5341007.1 adenosine deaminase family protein [Rubrivivax sp.]